MCNLYPNYGWHTAVVETTHFTQAFWPLSRGTGTVLYVLLRGACSTALQTTEELLRGT